MATAVSKPSNAGTPKTAIVKITGSFVNIRNGPSTNHDDIGDIINNTFLAYYPSSKTADGWFWVEQYGAAGWVYGGVIEFQDVATASLPNYPPTPYDGALAIWHWKGQSLPEKTIAQLATNLKKNAPNLKQVWVKIADGNAWQGKFDDGEMAINGVSDIDRWVQELNKHGLEFHAWIVLKGVDIAGEAKVMIDACKRPGVKSLILDVEPYAGYWEGGSGKIRPLMTDVRRGLGGAFHIGLSVDPRPHHYESIFPLEWFPFVNSVHPQTYWRSFKRPVQEVIEEVYRVWGGYGRPIIPALQGDAPTAEQLEANALVTQRFLSKGISWWRYGVIGQWEGVNSPITVNSGAPTTPTEQPPPGTQFGKEVVIFAGKQGFRSGTYTGKEELTKFTGAMGWEALYTSTESSTSKVWAEWKTELPDSGFYQISVFIPARHSTTRKARYKIHAVRGTTTEVVVDLNQSIYRNLWVPLGIFDLVKGQMNAGKVFLNDVTGEPDKEISFDAIRLRQIVRLDGSGGSSGSGGGTGPEIIDGVYVSDGFDSPVGSSAERRSVQVWPPGWRDASNYAVVYFEGTAREAYHTGADLNWGTPYEDQGLPVYATASGVVIYKANLTAWGNVTIIRHDPLKSPTGRVYYSRYGHMQNVTANVGQRVKRGEQIGEVGSGGGRFVPHLHYDISPTTVFENNPGDWPGKDITRVYRDYLDPLVFIRNNRP